VRWEAHPSVTRTTLLNIRARSIIPASSFDIDPATIRKHSRSGLCTNHCLMVLNGIIAAAAVIFEVIPMTMIPIVSVAVRQQEEHTVHPSTINKEEGEHNIAVPFYTVSSYLGRRNSTKQNSNAEKLLHISFQTSENIIKELKREATSKNIPLSILLNKYRKGSLDTNKYRKSGLHCN
jgi:hypothetical protein